jgi:molybdate transport system regulatory protein
VGRLLVCLRPPRRFGLPTGRPARYAFGGKEAVVRPKWKVWVAFDQEVKVGDGRAQLLELIDELGSLRRAVDRLGMSYRNAWGYLRDLERAAGFPLLERRDGGPGSGTRLTPKGRQFVAHYRRFRRRVAVLIEREFDRSFGKS